MQTDSITCPKCGKKIELNEAFSSQIEDRLRKEFDQQEKKREKQYEDALAAKDQEAEARVLKEKALIEKQAKKRAEEAISIELRDLTEQLGEKTKLLKTAEQNELALRKRERDLEAREQSQKLEFERKLESERKKIREEAQESLAEEHRLKEAESAKTLTDMRRQIEELKQKAEQGSQQMQGEILELDLEDLLRRNFPYDEIEAIGKGVKGGDVIQKIRGKGGAPCGQILWESKRTKAWSDSWVQKLKDDQRAAGADLSVIVSMSLPKDVSRFIHYEGIWITDLQCTIGLATALRNGLIQIAEARKTMVGKNEKMEMIYAYLAGPEFRRRVEAILESFVSMQHDLDSEKRAMEKLWAKRQKQIQRVIQGTGGMYGDVQGIVGADLPELALLQLPTDATTEAEQD